MSYSVRWLSRDRLGSLASDVDDSFLMLHSWQGSGGRPRRIMIERITFDTEIMGGRACIRGMRITVSLLVNLVANGMTFDEILAEYPQLEAEDLRHALLWAAALASEEVHPFTQAVR